MTSHAFKVPGNFRINIRPEGPARERWEAKTKDGTNVAFQGRCKDAVLVAADCLVHKPEMDKLKSLKQD